MNERSATGSAADRFPTRILGRPEVRELPAPPENTAQIIGPGIVAAGVGLASGEFILYPYIASQVGLVFVWAALVGVITQFFLNMEIERYTLATGETALTGFSRFWRHWGLVFALMTSSPTSGRAGRPARRPCSPISSAASRAGSRSGCSSSSG